jgi:hypothetical protein
MLRFWSKVEKTDSCWLWTAWCDATGYGRFRYDGKLGYAHRWAYENAFGRIPTDREIDHKCMIRHCVNPNHLELVTHAENRRRSMQAKRGCIHGHRYDDSNTYVNPLGYRSCRVCRRRHNEDFKKRSVECNI